jgi:PAS domain-containing protein
VGKHPHHTAVAVEAILDRALSAVVAGPDALRQALDDLPAAVYVTDADGVLTYFNPACVAFAGREPQVGQDRWCVTWKLYTDDGSPLPHDACPMAQAIHLREPIRGLSAIAERPDGTRAPFRPYPTPILAADGTILGAVNILLDTSDELDSNTLHAQARLSRRLADKVTDPLAAEALLRRADDMDARARRHDPPEESGDSPS